MNRSLINKFVNRYFLGNKPLEMDANVLSRRFSLIDIGARDGLQYPWDGLKRELLTVTFVEPDPVEAERLQNTIIDDETSVLPFALWKERADVTFHITRSPGVSSVYLPNRPFLDQFPEAERFDIVNSLLVTTSTIDELAESGKLREIDFAKIDVQGAELAILEGGEEYFAKNLVGLEIEVEFAEMYQGQPLFANVEAFVRERLGLELWDLRKSYWKYKQGMSVPGPIKGRLIFGDALFLRSPSGLEQWLEPMGRKLGGEKVAMLVISALVYGYADYASTLLDTPSISCYLDARLYRELQGALNGLGDGFRPFSNGSGLFVIFDAIARAFKQTHRGWASIGSSLGSRRRGPFWV